MSRPSDAELQELLDRQKCYDVLTRYCRALDRADLELMKSVYWEDGEDDHNVFKGNAMEFAEFIIREIQNWFEVTMHAICNIHMEYHGDVMCTESYLIAYHKVKGDRGKVETIFGPTYLSRLDWKQLGDSPHFFFYGGRYVDRLEKRNGEWRIAMRRVCMDWNENGPCNSIWDEGMFDTLRTRGSRDRNDPIYLNRPARR